MIQLMTKKRCGVCKGRLPLAKFHKDKTSRDGHCYACKECAKRRARAWTKKLGNKARHALASAMWRAANPEKHRALVNRQARTPAGRASAKAYRQRNKHAVRARGAINNHVRSGRLQRKPCSNCGAKKVQAHHEDYSKPLDVIWLCQKCHTKHHRSTRAT